MKNCFRSKTSALISTPTRALCTRLTTSALTSAAAKRWALSASYQGSGKSVTALSIIRLVQSPPGKIVAGEVLLDGEDLLKKSKAEMRHIRGEKVSMIFQEPMTAF